LATGHIRKPRIFHVQAASRPARLGVLLGQALRGASDESASGPRLFVPGKGLTMGKET